MKISETVSFYDLPQVKNFSFYISGISVSNFNPVSFKFYDTGYNFFSFDFESGFIRTDKIIYAYNNKDLINIEGYVENNKLYYKINEIFSEKNINFNSLDKLTINNIDTDVSFDIFINSNPIKYSFEVEKIYPFNGFLSGKITSDVVFNIKDYSLSFLKSNSELLSGQNNLTGKINSGNNFFTLKDIDVSNFEYLNLFSINFNTVFGNLYNNFSSYRGGLYDKKLLSLQESSLNIYEKALLFDGIWSGNNFYYLNNNQNYNLTFAIQNFNYLGANTSGLVFAKFESLYPLNNNNNYISEYVTGFELTNSGVYSGELPRLFFQKYYYVEGISQNLNNLLFSSGCQNVISINYSGNSTGEASGYLNLKNVRLSDFYGEGINIFKAAFGYNSYNEGSGYTGAPMIIFGTGGDCYSLPDIFGESGQFKKINNTFAKIKSHSDYLTGLPLVSGITGSNGSVTGFIVTGLKITNIGSGYNSVYPPKVKFLRSENDILNDEASGKLLFKQSGLYDFTGFFSINYNFNDQNVYSLNSYNNYYSGIINLPSDKKSIIFNINLSGLDNTNPISGLLTLKIKNDLEEKIIEKNIINYRYFNPLTGAYKYE